MSRYLVTGAGGVIGSALVDSLRSSGLDVIALASRRDCNLESLEETQAVFRYVKPTHIYHLAGAVFGLGGNSKFPYDVYRRNSIINFNVIEAGIACQVSKIVAMGSAAMYADGLPLPMREEDVLKDEPHSSERFYGFAKRAMLMHLAAAEAQMGLKWAFAISTNLYGPHDRFDVNYGHVIPSLLQKFLTASRTTKRVDVWGNGSATRDFLYSCDAAGALMLMMQKASGTINIATGTSYSIKQLVEKVQNLFPNVEVNWDGTKPNGQMERAYDLTNLKNLGFTSQYSLDEGLKYTSDWLIKNEDQARR